MTVVVDCHRPSAFAMTKGAKGDDFFFFSVFGGGSVVYGLPQAFGLRNDESGKE